MIFYVGQKVVCISNGKWRKNRRRSWWQRLMGTGRVSGPKNREVVTILGLDYDGYLVFVEYRQHCYPPHHFRPLVDKSTDISIFQEIARNPNAPAHSPDQPEGVV